MSILHRLEEKQSAAPDNSRNPHRSDSIESSLVREKGLTDVPWKLARSHISSLYMPNHIEYSQRLDIYRSIGTISDWFAITRNTC
jgi:hypothetical protein